MSQAPELSLLDAACAQRLSRRQSSAWPHLWELLDSVFDPEIPVLSLFDLGVLQDVQMAGECVRVELTPTYSGCPAIETMTQDIRTCLESAGYCHVEIVQKLAPAWGTHMMTPAAKAALARFNIAPPGSLACVMCGSKQVTLVSEFGSTACKAHYRCQSCGEPFDYFKPL